MLAIAPLFITCLSASGGQGSLQKGNGASSHAGDVTCLVRASTRSSSPQLLLLQVCIKPACSGSLSARVSVSRRNCYADWKEARRYAAVAYVTKRIYCLCMLCCLCIHIISACMDACICMHCGPEWTSCCALHCMARSLARLRREIKRAGLVVCRVVSAGCCCCVTGTVLLVRDIGRSVVFRWLGA